MNIQELLEKLEEERKKGNLDDNVIEEFNKSGALTLNTEINNVHNEALNKTGQNYADNAYKSQNQRKKIEFDKADKQMDIEKAASAVKNARSDETRKDLLEATNTYRDKQEDERYADVEEITDTQTRIANRQANMAAAKAGRNGDVYSDAGMANIKNDIINRYGQNILNAQQYALDANRNIDKDILNIGLTEVNDKDKRDALKNALLDKENSYMLNALEKAAEGDKKAVTDIENFYQNYVRAKADSENTSSLNTERREAWEKEFASLDPTGKANMLRELSANVPGYGIIADRIPSLISKYPNLSLGELRAKVTKIGEIALTGKQQLANLGAKSRDEMTDAEKAIYDRYITRGDEEFERSDRHMPETIAQANADQSGTRKPDNTIYHDSEEGQKIIKETDENEVNIRTEKDTDVLTGDTKSKAMLNQENKYEGPTAAEKAAKRKLLNNAKTDFRRGMELINKKEEEGKLTKPKKYYIQVLQEQIKKKYGNKL